MGNGWMIEGVPSYRRDWLILRLFHARTHLPGGGGRRRGNGRGGGMASGRGFQSRTAPTGNTLGRDSKRVPKTTTAGNMTRRTNAPRKRGGGDQGLDQEGLAVGGVSGIRALRQKGSNNR